MRDWLSWLFVLAAVWIPDKLNATTIQFSDFSNASAFTLNGAAATTNTGDGVVLRLTSTVSADAGSAFLTNPIQLEANASFSTYFRFRLTGGGLGGDGFMFVLQNQGATALGTAGGYLGYGHGAPNEAPAIQNSFGIEFDTFNNGSLTTGSGILDFDDNHVGLDHNGSLQSLLAVHTQERLNDGNVWNVWVDYQGSSQELEVRISKDASRPLRPTLATIYQATADLDSTTTFIGFTAGKFAAVNNQDILQWEFRDTYSPIGGIPEPSSFLLLIAGVGLIVGQRLCNKKSTSEQSIRA